LNMGGKEARRGLKDLYTELISSEHRASPLHHQKSDKRKGAILEKDPSKKARLESEDLIFPSSTETPPAEEKGVELGETCANCNLSVTTPKNQLIDCNECHNWYHQNCQSPPVPAKVLEQRANDARFVWKCNDCSNMILKMKEPKKKEVSKVKETNAQPFNRANSKITNIVKERSRSRENSPSSLGGGWAALGAKADSQKPKKEKKLQQFDMFGDQEPVKKKKEVNPNAIKALKEKERKKREGSQDRTEQKTKKTKSREQKDDDAVKKIANMKKKSAEKMKLKAAAKRV